MEVKGQIWFGDFAVGLIIFIIAVLLFMVYTTNIANISERKIEQLALQSRSIAEQFASNGKPLHWNKNNVQKIGLTTGRSKLGWETFNSLNFLSYSRSKQILNVDSDYFVFFQDENKNVINVGGNCGYGSSLSIPLIPPKLVLATINIADDDEQPGPGTQPNWGTKTYYYDPIIDLHIYRINKDLIYDSFGNLDGNSVAFFDPSGNPVNASDAFLINTSQHNWSNHSNFDFMWIDSNLYNKSERNVLAEYLYDDGNMLILNWWCHEMNPECKDGMNLTELDMSFLNTIDLNGSLGHARFINATIWKDPFFQIQIGYNLTVGSHNGESTELNAIKPIDNSSNHIGLAYYRAHTDTLMQHPDSSMNFLPPYPGVDSPGIFSHWQYGFGNGFFLGINYSYVNTSANETVCPNCNPPNNIFYNLYAGSIRVGAKCGYLDLTNLKFEHLVPTERLLYYDGKFIKMVVYAWQ